MGSPASARPVSLHGCARGARASLGLDAGAGGRIVRLRIGRI